MKTTQNEHYKVHFLLATYYLLCHVAGLAMVMARPIRANIQYYRDGK